MTTTHATHDLERQIAELQTKVSNLEATHRTEVDSLLELLYLSGKISGLIAWACENDNNSQVQIDREKLLEAEIHKVHDRIKAALVGYVPKTNTLPAK